MKSELNRCGYSFGDRIGETEKRGSEWTVQYVLVDDASLRGYLRGDK